ncbi:hypothetical protein GCM10020256_50430 [Streptomyces thermocoprophilus]
MNRGTRTAPDGGTGKTPAGGARTASDGGTRTASDGGTRAAPAGGARAAVQPGTRTVVERRRRHTLYFLEWSAGQRPVHLDTDIDMTRVQEHRAAAKARGTRYSVVAYLLHATGRALARHPEANAVMAPGWPSLLRAPRIVRFPGVTAKLALDRPVGANAPSCPPSYPTWRPPPSTTSSGTSTATAANKPPTYRSSKEYAPSAACPSCSAGSPSPAPCATRANDPASSAPSRSARSATPRSTASTPPEAPPSPCARAASPTGPSSATAP